MKLPISHERLKELLFYDPQAGVFTWKTNRSGIKVGDEAGSLLHTGYVYIRVDGKRYVRSRLAWFYAHGVWPKEFIDHKNSNRADDRLENLREATCAENNRNSRRPQNNASGFRGVTWKPKLKRWEAKIRDGKNKIYLGCFKSGEEAHKAYCEASAKLHGEFSCLNRL